MTTQHPLILFDSIGYISERRGPQAVIVCGSHGGTSAAGYVLALRAMPHAVFFNDAGFGKDDAGIAGLPQLDARGVIAAVYAHTSARIGDSADGLANGVITHANQAAQAAGIRTGQTVIELARRLCGDAAVANATPDHHG